METFACQRVGEPSVIDFHNRSSIDVPAQIFMTLPDIFQRYEADMVHLVVPGRFKMEPEL